MNIVTFEEVKRMWFALDDEGKRQGLNRSLGLDIPEGAENIHVYHLYFERVGSKRKFVPADRFSTGWPTYYEVEEGIYQENYSISWCLNGQRYIMRFSA